MCNSILSSPVTPFTKNSLLILSDALRFFRLGKSPFRDVTSSSGKGRKRKRRVVLVTFDKTRFTGHRAKEKLGGGRSHT